jgi:hypothetical protein
MRLPQLLMAAALLLPAVGPAVAADKEQAKGDKVDYEVHSGYLQRVKYYQAFRAKDKSNFGTLCFVAFSDQAAFDKAFGKSEGKVNLSVFLPNGEKQGAKPNFLAKDAFDKKIVACVIHSDMNVYQFKVAKVTADGTTLYVQYEATSTSGYPNSYSCPLIVSVDRSKYTSVVFIENGKKFGTAKVPKQKGKDK